MDNLSFSITPGSKLSSTDVASVNSAKDREWDLPPMDKNHLERNSFAFLKDKGAHILAQCELIPAEDISLSGKVHPIIGIGGVIAEQKGQGHGRLLMEKVIAWLKASDTIGLGFAGNDVIGFYEKCGFISDPASLKRFVHQDGDVTITNTTEDCVFYLDSRDGLLQKALSQPENIFLQRDPDW